MCGFNSVKGDRFHLAFTQDFHDSAAPYDDLIWVVVRGGQTRCYCNSSQKYMRACFDFLILENVFFVVCRAVGTNGNTTWLPVVHNQLG